MVTNGTVFLHSNAAQCYNNLPLTFTHTVGGKDTFFSAPKRGFRIEDQEQLLSKSPQTSWPSVHRVPCFEKCHSPFYRLVWVG